MHAHMHAHVHAYARINKHLRAHTQLWIFTGLHREKAAIAQLAKPPKAEVPSVPGLERTVWEFNSTTQSSKIYMIMLIKEVMEDHTDVG